LLAHISLISVRHEYSDGSVVPGNWGLGRTRIVITPLERSLREARRQKSPRRALCVIANRSRRHRLARARPRSHTSRLVYRHARAWHLPSELRCLRHERACHTGFLSHLRAAVPTAFQYLSSELAFGVELIRKVVLTLAEDHRTQFGDASFSTDFPGEVLRLATIEATNQAIHFC
jgi:hypothetical protein